jgi:hypothetical protein
MRVVCTREQRGRQGPATSLLSWVEGLVASLRDFEKYHSLSPFFGAEEGPEGQVRGNRAEVSCACAFETRAVLDYVGDRLRVDAAVGAVGGFAWVKAGCIRAYERVTRGEEHQGSAGRAGTPAAPAMTGGGLPEGGKGRARNIRERLSELCQRACQAENVSSLVLDRWNAILLGFWRFCGRGAAALARARSMRRQMPAIETSKGHHSIKTRVDLKAEKISVSDVRKLRAKDWPVWGRRLVMA